MANKLKDFLFPSKGKDDLDSTTVIYTKKEEKLSSLEITFRFYTDSY